MNIQSVLTDEHLHAIGLVTAEWAELEFFLHATIWAIADIDNPGRGNALTDHLRAQQLSHALESVALDRIGESPEYDDIKSMCTEIRRLYGERNKYAHAKWQIDNVDHQVYRLNRRHQKRLVAGWDAIGVKEIQSVAHEISDVTARLDRLFFQYKPDSWPDELRRPGSQ